MDEFERYIYDRLREAMPTCPLLWCFVCGADTYPDEPHECAPRTTEMLGLRAFFDQ